MIRELRRLNLELDLFSARRRADEYRPFSPAWDIAMDEVETLERELWRFDQLPEGTTPHNVERGSAFS